MVTNSSFSVVITSLLSLFSYSKALHFARAIGAN